MTQAESYDMIVVGAGISGLSLANYIARLGKKVLVLDAADKIGGCLNTYYKDDFWVEMGAHTFYATYTNLIDLIQKNGLEQDIVARKKIGMKVFTDEHEKMMSGVSKCELVRSIPNLFFSKRNGKTVKNYFGKIVGRKNYDKVFSRMFSAVIVQNANNFSAEYFLKKRKTKSKKHPKSFILKKGMASFMEALENHENIEVKLNVKINQLVKHNNEFKVKAELGDEFKAKDISLAISPKLGSELTKNLSADLSNVLADFPIQHIESRTVVLPKEKLNFDPVSFIIPLQSSCFSMVTRDVMTDEKLRGFSFHFEEKKMSKEEQERFMKELLLIDSLDSETIEAKHKLPLIKIGHFERMTKIKQLAEKSGIYITGNYFNGLSLEDCVERSKEEFERYCRHIGLSL